MEFQSIKKHIPAILNKYKYVALVLIIGLALLLLPTKDNNKESKVPEMNYISNDRSVEEDLEDILSKINGAGKVEVLLTEEKGEKTTYQTDSDVSRTENSDNQTVKTITITTSEKNEEGLVVQKEPPIYLGAIVVSEGADRPSVKLALVEAVSKVTGLGANQITVLKMK